MKAGRLATVTTVAAACAAVGLIVASCSSQTGNPSQPGSVLGSAHHLDATPTASPGPSPTPTPSPSAGNCSPGFWKNHALNNPGNQPNLWFGPQFGVCDVSGAPSCASILEELNDHGTASNDAAAFLNSQQGIPPFPAFCTERS